MIGKTLQSLVSVALAHFDTGTLPADQSTNLRSLVVCPSTLVGHWVAEIEKYFPGQRIFRVLALSGNRSGRQALWWNMSTHTNIVVTSYAVLRSDIEYLERESFCYCILDEGHLMKNAKTGKPETEFVHSS